LLKINRVMSRPSCVDLTRRTDTVETCYKTWTSHTGLVWLLEQKHGMVVWDKRQDDEPGAFPG
jgi:hypothetical protein